MKRKTIITITGNDNEEAVTVSTKFVPDLDTKDEPPNSGWSAATHIMLKALTTLAKKHPDDEENP